MAAVWGLTFPVVKDAVARIPVMTFLGYRFLPAAAIVAVVFRHDVRQLSRDGWRAGLVMGVFLTGLYVFQTLGLDLTSSSHAGFITGMFVVLTPLFAAVVLRARVEGFAWPAALVSAVGLLLLSGTGGKGTSLVGDALVFVGACCFALHLLATDRGVERHAVGALLAVQLAVVGVFCSLVAAARGDLVIPDSQQVWSALVVTSLVASALGFFVQTYAQQHASPVRTALILASEPAFAGLFAYLLKGETLTLLAWFGAALIMVTVVAVELRPYLRARPVET